MKLEIVATSSLHQEQKTKEVRITMNGVEMALTQTGEAPVFSFPQPQ